MVAKVFYMVARAMLGGRSLSSCYVAVAILQFAMLCVVTWVLLRYTVVAKQLLGCSWGGF